MEKYNRVGIKQLIKKYPDIGKVLLDDYKINCMVCKGNCHLKNVVEEENLSLQDEIDLMKKINGIISNVESKV
jgi:hypothetical protein